MAEQLAENYHNTWGRKKKQELEAKGEGIHPLLSLLRPPTPAPARSLGASVRVLTSWCYLITLPALLSCTEDQHQKATFALLAPFQLCS